MLTLPLEPLDEDADPAFTGASSCKKWLKQLPYASPSATQALLRTQLEEFNRYPVRGVERMQALEALRDAVHELQDDCAKRLAGKPLPLNEAELVMLASITGLWQAMAVGYQRCLLAFEEGERQLKAYGALLCHRCLMYSGRQIFEFLRNGYEFDGQQWRQFHSVYLFAEEHDLLTEEVEDEFNDHGHLTTCRFMYLKTLFACHARVQELTFHQQELLDHWLTQWADSFTIARTCAVSRGDAPPLAIDPASTQGLQAFKPEFLDNSSILYLPMVPMSKQLRVTTILLQQGQSPKQLGLGDEHDRLDCIDLLTHLHRHWCEPRPQRMAERTGSNQVMQLRYGVEDIYALIARQPFDSLKPGSAPIEETWRTEDLSILGARLLRMKPDGARLGINRLVSVCAGTNACQLANVVWVSVMRTGHLHMGIRFLPGTPAAVSVRPVIKPGEPVPKTVPGLLLSAVPSLNIPASLLLPRNVFQPERIVEVTLMNNQRQKLRLKYSVEKRVDFERVSFLVA